MNHALYLMMLAWLETGDESQRHHARVRLSQPDAAAYPPPPLLAAPVPGATRAPAEYPPVQTQIASAGRAALGAAADLLAGRALVVDQAEQDRRLAICRACPQWDAEQGRCRACGCFGSLKARLASQHCPEGRW